MIKYPVMSFDDLAVYHRLPWDESAVVANAPDDEIVVPAPDPEVEPTESDSSTVSATATDADASEDTRERSSG